MKFTLESKSQAKDCKETVYHYLDEDGQKAAFHSHPTQAFLVVCVEGEPALIEKLYDAFIEMGLEQHSFEGGFNEAISVLEIQSPALKP